jgi:hypothetical protein
MMALVTTLITVPIVELIYPPSTRIYRVAETHLLDNEDSMKLAANTSLTRLGVVVDKIEDGKIS